MTKAATQSLSSLFAEGETVSHEVVRERLGFRTVRATKEWLNECEIPYTPAGRFWFVDSGDIRAAMKAAARPHAEHQREREALKERKPAKR